MLQEILHFGQRLIALALPPTCQACGALLPATEPIGVCPTCWKNLPKWNTKLLPTPNLPSNLASFAAPFVYEDPVRQWITGLKFHDQTHLAKMLAEFMAQHIPKGDVLLVPVPIHSSRLRWRLFNQSALLAQEIATCTRQPWAAAGLTRTQKTIPQVGKTRRERLQLSSKIFTADAAQVAGKTIVLVDDLYTTGATANACAKALLKAGAKEVHALTIAYVAP